MDAKHRRFNITIKTNRKKRTGFKLLSSNQTFYLTFLLSIAFHVGILYSIPAVDLFSNSANADDKKMIVLDLLDTEDVSLSDELALSEEQEHQFQAAVPDIPWDWSEEARESEPDAVVETDDIKFAPMPKIAELKNEYTLVSEAQKQEPDVQELLAQKRDSEDLLKRPFRTRRSDSEKPDAEQIRPTPVDQLETAADERPPSLEAIQKNSPPERKNTPEDVLSFPRHLQNPEERQKPRLAEKNLTRPALQERALKEPPKLPALRTDAAEVQKRRLGLARENAEDKNRFGIFAGERFETPDYQEALPLSETDKQEAVKTDDVTQTAESLPTESGIEGPVKGRAIVYRPSPPKIGSIAVEVELRLRFWVLPDGTIGEVIPMKRGDTQLEQIAIGYLKKWQFEALAADAPQKEIWGTIPIKFTAQ